MMNNNNNNNTINNSKNNTMNNAINCTAAAATMTTPAQKPQPGTPSALYKLAARNLREYHGVPSMTALKLEKTVALLGLAPRRLVVQGLASRRLLAEAGEGSGNGEEKLGETETGDLMDASDENNNNSCSSSSEEEEKGVSDDSDSSRDDYVNSNNNSNVNSNSNNNGGVTLDGVELLGADDSGKAGRPIHDALVAGSINLRPRETRPLLRALGVRPHRLVRLGLVKREALRAMPAGRRGGPGQRQRLGAGGPRKGGMGRPHGPPHGPPRGLGGRPMHGPPRPFDGDGHHTRHLAEEGEGEEHGRGPPGGGKHGHGHRHPPHGHGRGPGHGHGNSGSEGEEGRRLGGAAPGPEQHGPGRHEGGRGRSHEPPHGPPRGSYGPFLGSFREGGASGAPHGMMAHPWHGSPSRGGGGMKKRGSRHGGTGFCGGGGGGGGHRQHGRVAHLAHSDSRHQQQLLLERLEAC